MMLNVRPNRMKIIETMKQRQHRPAIIIGLVILIYLWFSIWPDVARLCSGIWLAISDLSGSGLRSLLWRLTELLCLLAGVAAWILSVYLALAAFRKSRNRGYAFILASLLLPAITLFARQAVRPFLPDPRIRQYHAQQAEMQARQPESESTRMAVPLVAKRKISLPVGPLLLLAGLWYLYRKETTNKAIQIIAAERGKT